MAGRGGGMGRARRPWGSAPGGRDGGQGGRSESGYDGRDEGRGRDRYNRGYNDSYDGDSRGKYDRGGNQVKDQGWSRGRSRSRSRSPEKLKGGPPARSFHEMMMERARSSTPKHHDRSFCREDEDEEGAIPSGM